MDAQKAKEEAIRERRNLGVAAVAGRLADFAEVLQQVPEDARAEAGALLDKAVHGDATYVVGSNYTRYPASYIALAPGVAQASHLPGKNFAVNPEYGNGAVQNTRDYQNDATEQGKVRKMAAAGAYDEGGEVTDVKSAAEGPIQVVLAVFNGADGKPAVRFIAAGGNGRLQGRQLSSIEDQQRISDEWQRKQANFGFHQIPDGYDGYRFLGVYDLRNEAQRTAYQTLVDKLNPSSGVVQDAGKRARIDAGDKIPVSAFADLPLSLSASQATEAVKSWVRDAEKYGLDRNLMASIAGDPPSAQSYARQLILHGAFRSPALTSFYFDQHGGSGTATAKGLIEASTRAALAMREKGFDAAADALGKTLATVADYVKNGTRIDRALTKAAEQMEMGADAKIVNTIAQAMKDKVEVFPANKRGIANVDAESTVEGFNELMDDLARGVSQFSPEPDLLGETDTLDANIARGLAAHARRNQEHGAAPVQSGQPQSRRARDQHADARRMRELQRKSREEGLTQMEGLEMEGLERRAGQSFMGFFNELRPDFKLSQEGEFSQTPQSQSVPMQQGALLSKKSADGTPESEYRSNRHERDTKQPAKTTASHGAGSPDASAEPLPGQGELRPRSRGVVGGRGGQPGEVQPGGASGDESYIGTASGRTGDAPGYRRELDSRGRDLRLVKLFGEDWQYGWNALGLPNQPTPLREGHPLIANPTRGKTVAILTGKSKAVRLGLLPAGSHSRKALWAAIRDYFLAGGDGETHFDDIPQMHAGEPEIMLLGGGGGAGKSSMLGKLAERGEFDAKNRVLINPDEIREFLPEFEMVRDLGDARGSSVSHEEAGAIADELYAEALARKLSITYDATLKNGEKWLAEIARLQAEGYRVRMVAVTIDPHEALVRAYLRGKSKGRYVPDEELFKAHKGFNAALPGYADALGHEITIYDNTPKHAIRIAPDEMQSGPARDITDRRAQLDPLAKDIESLLASYGDGMQSDALMARRAVTPEQGAEYLAAVESGDMATAQRMVDAAAEAAGYDTTPLYHGSPYGDITVFDETKAPDYYPERAEDDTRSNYWPGTTWLSDSKFVADEYSAGMFASKHRGEHVRNISHPYKPLPKGTKVWAFLNHPKDMTRIHASVDGDGKLQATAELKTPTGRQRKGIQWKVELPNGSTLSGWQFNDISPQDAYDFAEDIYNSPTPQFENSRTYRLYAKIKNPKVIDMQGGQFSRMGRKAAEAQAEGHDAIIVKNVRDPGLHAASSPVATSIGIFDRRAIKSADPITRDEHGSVIPLSERFSPEEDSFLLSRRAKSDPNQGGFSFGDEVPASNGGQESARETKWVPATPENAKVGETIRDPQDPGHDYGTITGISMGMSGPIVRTSKRARNGKGKFMLRGFEIEQKNPLTPSVPASKDNHHGTKQLPNTDRGNAPKSARNGGLGELFHFMAGHREAERREGVAGGRQDGTRGRAGQQDLGLFANDGGRLPDGSSGSDAGAIPDVGGAGAADTRSLRAGESANAGDRPGRRAGSAAGDAVDGGGGGKADSNREGSDGRGAGGRREPGLVERPADPLAAGEGEEAVRETELFGPSIMT